MDLLDRVAVPGADLLERADGVLARFGAPPGHRVLALLRSVGAPPSSVLAGITALDPQGLTAAMSRASAASATIRDAIDEVPLPSASAGAAAEHFGAAWRNLAAQVTGGPGDLAGRVEATAAHLGALATWAADTRHDLAVELGTCLGSAEAVTIRSASDTPDPAVIIAAAEVAARILGAASRAVDAGWRAHDAARDLADAVALRPYDGSATAGNVIDLR